jgi:hypothetical protein
VEEMWSSVGKKQEPRWLWHAIEHGTGKVLADVFGRRRDEVFLHLKPCWSPLASRASLPIIGGHTLGILVLRFRSLVNVIRSRLNASI